MNAKEYRRRWLAADELAQGAIMGREIWRARAEAAEAKLSAAREFVAEANEEFTKAAAEDAAMVERFNG